MLNKIKSIAILALVAIMLIGAFDTVNASIRRRGDIHIARYSENENQETEFTLDQIFEIVKNYRGITEAQSSEVKLINEKNESIQKISTFETGTYSLNYKEKDTGFEDSVLIVVLDNKYDGVKFQKLVPNNATVEKGQKLEPVELMDEMGINKDIQDKVTVSHNINWDKSGTYVVTFKYINVGIAEISWANLKVKGSTDDSTSSSNSGTSVYIPTYIAPITTSDPYVYVRDFNNESISTQPSTDSSTQMVIVDNTASSYKDAVIYASNKTLKVGDKFKFMQGVTAKDNGGQGASLTDKITISGKINTYVAGNYRITYKVKGANGKTVSKAVTITVK